MYIDSLRIIGWLLTGKSQSPYETPVSDSDPDPGIMGPDSITWRLHSEQWLIWAGGRAFLMQAAHPKVAQGALGYSAYAEDPFGRVYRTILAMSVLLMGSTREVNAMARHINRLHQTVQGTFTESIGPYHAGEPYSGTDKDGLLWVHAVFVDSVLAAYQNFVGPLSDADRNRYYQESCRCARRLGLTHAMLPPTYAAMQDYVRQAIASGEVTVGNGARIISQTILYPPLPCHRQLLWGLVRLITIGQLSPEIRRGYGLRWTSAHQLGFRVLVCFLRLLRWAFPDALGHTLPVDFAERRVRGELLKQQAEPARR